MRNIGQGNVFSSQNRKACAQKLRRNHSVFFSKKLYLHFHTSIGEPLRILRQGWTYLALKTMCLHLFCLYVCISIEENSVLVLQSLTTFLTKLEMT